MKNNKGFTVIETLISLLICAIILSFLIPNLVREYYYITDMENQIEMKEVLYEEILNNSSDSTYFIRDNYEVKITESYAYIKNINTGDYIEYKK